MYYFVDTKPGKDNLRTKKNEYFIISKQLFQKTKMKLQTHHQS